MLFKMHLKREMKSFTKIEIVELIESEDIEFLNLQFTNFYGKLKTITISSACIEKILNNKCSIKKNALYGIDDGDTTRFYLKPILSTFCVLPWRPQQGKVARMLCDIYDEQGNEFKDSSRYILKRAVAHAGEMGYEVIANIMCKFFLFNSDNNGMPLAETNDSAGYLENSSNDQGVNYRRDLSLTLEEMGYQIEALYHECAPAQQEIDFSFDSILETADKIMTFKLAADSIACRYGYSAVFMPKPREDFNGSGMHLRICLVKDGRNIFEDRQGDFNEVGQAFLAGILMHIKSMTAFCNPVVNSYKRLNYDFDAPTEIIWSTNQQKAVVLVQKDPDAGIILEIRSPDPSCNPYILMAICIEAGLDGIQTGLRAPNEVKEDILSLSEEQRKKMNLEKLPENLGEALKIMKKDSWIKNILGDTFVNNYTYYKENEWRCYQKHISKWELVQYLRTM